MPSVDVQFFVSSVLLQQETGGNLGEILTKLAYIIRERFRLKGQVQAVSAHGRITGLVLLLMPVGVVHLHDDDQSRLPDADGGRPDGTHDDLRRGRRPDRRVLRHSENYRYQGLIYGTAASLPFSFSALPR